MATFKQKMYAPKTYMGWYGVCPEGGINECEPFKLVSDTNEHTILPGSPTTGEIGESTIISTIISYANVSGKGYDGTASYRSDLNFATLKELICGNAYIIVLKPGTDPNNLLEFEIPEFVIGNIESDEKEADEYILTTTCGAPPPVTIPIIGADDAANIHRNAADLSGSVVYDGGEAPTITVFYGTADGSVIVPGQDMWQNQRVLSTFSTGDIFSKTINVPDENTLYYFQFKAENSAGVVRSEVKTFTTLCTLSLNHLNFAGWGTRPAKHTAGNSFNWCLGTPYDDPGVKNLLDCDGSVLVTDKNDSNYDTYVTTKYYVHGFWPANGYEPPSDGNNNPLTEITDPTVIAKLGTMDSPYYNAATPHGWHESFHVIHTYSKDPNFKVHDALTIEVVGDAYENPTCGHKINHPGVTLPATLASGQDLMIKGTGEGVSVTNVGASGSLWVAEGGGGNSTQNAQVNEIDFKVNNSVAFTLQTIGRFANGSVDFSPDNSNVCYRGTINETAYTSGECVMQEKVWDFDPCELAVCCDPALSSASVTAGTSTEFYFPKVILSAFSYDCNVCMGNGSVGIPKSVNLYVPNYTHAIGVVSFFGELDSDEIYLEVTADPYESAGVPVHVGDCFKGIVDNDQCILEVQ